MALAVIFVGLARCGKDTAADYIAERYGFEKFVFSDVIADELRRAGMGVTKPNMSEMGRRMRAAAGMDAVAKKLYLKIKGREKVVLVGPRSVEEVGYMRKNFGNCIVVALSTPAEKRFERRSSIDPAKREEFFRRDSEDIEEKGLGRLIEGADRKIENDSSLAALYRKLDALVKGLEKNH